MRLIDADALIADLERQYAEVFGKARKTVNPDDFYIERSMAYHAGVVETEQNSFFEYLKTRSTVDAVEVVHCRDCRYSVVPKCHKEYCEENGILKCDKPGGIAFNRRVYSSDFCSYGKFTEDT